MTYGVITMSNGGSWPPGATAALPRNAPWPTPYRPATDPSTNSEPRLERAVVLALAPQIKDLFLQESQDFGESYCALSSGWRKNHAQEASHKFIALFRKHLKPDPNVATLAVANEHDFANLHRSVWLLLLHAITRVLNFNIHTTWGDPDGGATTQGRYDDDWRVLSTDSLFHFHTTPNATGSFAVSTQDFPAPDLGIGEANATELVRDYPKRDTLGTDEIRRISHDVARAVAGGGIGPAYHEIVKKYYRDRGDHTSAYALQINQCRSGRQGKLTPNDVANVHRGTWLFLAHRFAYLAGENPFGTYGDVSEPTNCVSLPMIKDVQGPRTFEVPNSAGEFCVNLRDIDA